MERIRALTRAALVAGLLAWPAAARAAFVVEVRPAGTPLYAPVGPEWGRALGLGDAPPRALAPVVAQLSGPLGLTPALYAALPTQLEKQAALSMAEEAAPAAVEQKVYELAVAARAAASVTELPDREGRASLFQLVSDLREIRDHYSGLLHHPDAREELDRANASATASAARARAQLLGAAATGASAFDGTKPAPAAAGPAPVLKPSLAARKTLETFENSPWGRKAGEIDAVYRGYGFESRNAAGSHRFYSHPLFPAVSDTVPNHAKELAPKYAQTVIKNIRKLEELYAAAGRGPAAAAEAAVDGELGLEELRVLLPPPAIERAREVKIPVEEPPPASAPRLAARLKKAKAAPVAAAEPAPPPPPAPQAPTAVAAEPRITGGLSAVTAFIWDQLRKGVAALIGRRAADAASAPAEPTLSGFIDQAREQARVASAKNPTRAAKLLKKKDRR